MVFGYWIVGVVCSLTAVEVFCDAFVSLVCPTLG